ncbi:MAG TPA: hypothetical protein VFE37_11970, partial [Chloroflexota bacterium]|nr:hypothetical protein [Chloroflexota bacterium]
MLVLWLALAVVLAPIRAQDAPPEAPVARQSGADAAEFSRESPIAPTLDAPAPAAASAPTASPTPGATGASCSGAYGLYA